MKYSDAGRIEHVGVENLPGDSSFGSVGIIQRGSQTPYMADEQHASDGISFEDCKNCWARQIITLHFWHSGGDDATQRQMGNCGGLSGI